jgi:hypothetical protein
MPILSRVRRGRHYISVRNREQLLTSQQAVFFPGALFYLSLFYSRKQFAFRTAILYSGSQLGNAFGGLFAIGILELDDERGLEGWRWVRTSFALLVPLASNRQTAFPH